jgi:hypothetical protein
MTCLNKMVRAGLTPAVGSCEDCGRGPCEWLPFRTRVIAEPWKTATLISNAEILAEFKKWKRVAMPSCDENGFYPEWLYGEASGFHAGYLAGQRGFDKQSKSFDQLMSLSQELVDSLRLATVLLMGSSGDAEGMELGRVRARIDAVNLLILKADNLLFGGEKVANDQPETPINKEI